MSPAVATDKVLESKSYVRIDEHGVYRVGNTHVMYDSVLAGFHKGESPEYIQQGYPALSLEQIHGSIAYYLGHREEVDAYLARQKAIGEHWRQKLEKNPDPLIERLRALKRAMIQEGS